MVLSGRTSVGMNWDADIGLGLNLDRALGFGVNDHAVVL